MTSSRPVPLTAAFEGPGRVETATELPTIPGIVDPRIVALTPLTTGERVSLPRLSDRQGGLSLYEVRVERDALGPVRLQVIVERSDEGPEPAHVIEWYILHGPKPPEEI